MSNSFKFILITILSALFFATAVQAEKVDDVIKKVQKRYNKVKTIQIDFREKVRFSLTGAEVEVPASLQMMGKESFRLDSDDQMVVNNGKVLWRYNKIDSQVLVDYAKKTDQDVMLNTFLTDFGDQYYSLLIDESKAGGKTIYQIKLTPKPEEQSIFTSINIWVIDGDWEIKRLVYEDYNGNTTEYFIEKTQFNPSFSSAVFNFTPPEGIEVIDLRY